VQKATGGRLIDRVRRQELIGGFTRNYPMKLLLFLIAEFLPHGRAPPPSDVMRFSAWDWQFWGRPVPADRDIIRGPGRLRICAGAPR